MTKKVYFYAANSCVSCLFEKKTVTLYTNLFIMTAREFLHKNNIQYTFEREQVVQYMMDHRIHPTADEVFSGMKQMDSTISRATVFNTLKVLADRCAVTMLLIEEGVVRYDICTEPHAHFRCCQCGKIMDVAIRRNVSLDIPKGCVARQMQYIITGFCLECAKH